MHEALCSPVGRQAVTTAIETIGRTLRDSLWSGRLGGTQFWTNVSILGPNTEQYGHVAELLGQSSGQVPAQDMFDHRGIVHKMRDRSVRLRMSCRDANLVGDIPLDHETPYEGNIVVPLIDDSEWLLIVSLSGLSWENNERIADLIARTIQLQLPGIESAFGSVPWHDPNETTH